MDGFSIVAGGVNKSYKGVQALKDISFSVRKGEIFGLIGPDGAGKTTLFRILATLLLADSGNVSLEGFDVVKDYKKIRKELGYMPGRFSLYSDLSVRQNLAFYATIFGTTVEENYHLIKDIFVQLEPFKNRLAANLSGGMKQKLALCCALIHKPRVLILDEPTTGVDAVSRKEFWEMLQRLKIEGITILVSTPYMDEASLCDRVALMQGGQFLAIDKPEVITERFQNQLYAVRSKEMFRLVRDLRTYHKTGSAYIFGQDIHLSLKSDEDLKGLELWLTEKDHSDLEIRKVKPGIEDCFIELMSAGKEE